MVDWERMVNGWKGDHYYSVRLNKVTDFLLLLLLLIFWIHIALFCPDKLSSCVFDGRQQQICKMPLC